MLNDATMPIDPNVETNLEQIMKDLGGSDDLVVREIQDDGTFEVAAAVVYIDGLSDSAAINCYILDVLMNSLRTTSQNAQSDSVRTESWAKELLIGMGPINPVTNMTLMYKNLLSGEAIIFFKDHHHAYRADIREWKGRDVTESTNQTSVRGPREGKLHRDTSHQYSVNQA